MKIGIVVFSNTGHTAKLAKLIAKKLTENNHAVELLPLEIAGRTSPVAVSVALKSTPLIDEFDAVIFGFPVWGGKPPVVMSTYLDRVGSLEGKKAACFATHFFFPAWGGNQSLNMIKGICKSKGADFLGTGSVQWFSLRRNALMNKVAEEISAYF